MSIDPLSPATRTTKRNLLVASVLAITYKAFNVSIEKIPIAGLSINFDNRVFGFLLTIVLTYFIFTFALYYYIDIRNALPTDHQVGAEKRYTDDVGSYAGRIENQYMAALSREYPDYAFVAQGAITHLLKNIEKSDVYAGYNSGSSKLSPLDGLMIYRRGVRQNIQTNDLLDKTTHREFYLNVAAQIRRWARHYRGRFLLNQALAAPRLYAVRAVYLTRIYGTDGILPIFLAILAFLALYDIVPLGWLQRIAPPVPTK